MRNFQLKLLSLKFNLFGTSTCMQINTVHGLNLFIMNFTVGAAMEKYNQKHGLRGKSNNLQ